MLSIGIAIFSMFYFLTQYMQNILGWSPIRTGVGFLPMTAGIVVAAGLASTLVGKIGIRIPLIVGPALATAGIVWISRITPTSTYLDILGPLVVMALGMGFSFVPLTLAGVSGVQDHEAGLASALLNTMQQVGGAIGLAVLATVAIDATNSKLHALATSGSLTNASSIATTHGYTTAFGVAAAISAVGLLISILFIRMPPQSTRPDQRHSDSGRIRNAVTRRPAWFAVNAARPSGRAALTFFAKRRAACISHNVDVTMSRRSAPRLLRGARQGIDGRFWARARERPSPPRPRSHSRSSARRVDALAGGSSSSTP